MKTKYIYIAALILVLSSCAVRQAATESQMSNEKECAELYGELEAKEIHITQDMVGFFGFNSSVLPKDDTIVIVVPNKINPDIICWITAYYNYYNGARISVCDEPDLPCQQKEELRKRIFSAFERIQFPRPDDSGEEKFFVPETTITEGVDENGLCWKTVNFEFMSYGYDCVPPEHKWYFDRVLESFHKKTPSYQEVFEELLKTL